MRDELIMHWIVVGQLGLATGILIWQGAWMFAPVTLAFAVHQVVE